MIPVLASILIYGFIHSLLAAKSTKDWVQDRYGARFYHGWYRLGYNIFAILTFIPTTYLIVFREGGHVWNLGSGWELPLLIIQAIGWIGFIVSLIQIDLLRFAGIKQAWAYLTNRPLPLSEEALQTGGLYALIRHPLYLFSLMVIWPVTTMTEGYLGFCLGVTLYLIVGSYYEEKRLVAAFGETYVRYQKRVPWVFPATLL